MSRRPKSFSMAANVASICPISPMWQASTEALPPASRMDAATASQGSALRLEMMTCAPCAASRRAMASPMPRLEPVTRATLPVRSNGFFRFSALLMVLKVERCTGRASQLRLGDDAQATLLQVAHERPEGGEGRVARVAFLEALVDLLRDAGQAEQAIHRVEIEVVHAEAGLVGVVADHLFAREHALGIGRLTARALHEHVVVGLHPVGQRAAPGPPPRGPPARPSPHPPPRPPARTAG